MNTKVGHGTSCPPPPFCSADANSECDGGGLVVEEDNGGEGHVLVSEVVGVG
jgi:hypothetical protein